MNFLRTNYDLIAEEWCSSRTGLPPRDQRLFLAFVSRLPARARVLDLGCGSGMPMDRVLVARGFRVLGVDRSTRLLERARENVPGAEFIAEDFETFAVRDSYDGVVLWDCIFHLPRERHRRMLAKIFAALKPGGLLLVSSGGSDVEQEPFTDVMFGVEFSYDAFPPDRFLALAQDIGFGICSYTMLNEPDGGRDKGRLGVLLIRD